MYSFFKRIFDFFAALFGIIVLSPILIIVSIAIAITSRGGVFFKQIRVGKNGKLFKILKFRTMVSNAEAKGMQITVGDDKRITKIGKVLRKTKIDELPQLFNVLIGNMSFVGPRPEVPKYVELYSEEQRKVLTVKPGITDLASIEYKDENDLLQSDENPEQKYIQEIMPAKLALNMQYIEKRGFFYDIGLIMRTLWKIIR